MSVVQLDFFDREDLNGAVIDTITDEDTFFEGFEMRIALRDLGSGLLTASRQGISADAPFFIDIARSEAFVRVLVPEISSDYLFGFFLDTRKSQVLSQDESAGLDITVGGPGSLYYLSRGIFWNERFSGLSGFTFDEASGLIRFPAGMTPGDVLASFFQEDAANTIAEFIPALTKDFSENTDSDGNAWDDTFGDGLEFAVGTHYLQALRICQEASTDLDVVMELGSPGSPQMLLRAFNRYGRDLTGTSFGAGTVLWKAGINSDPLSGNILTGLEASGTSTRKPSHVLVLGGNNIYQRVTKGGYAAGQFTKAVALDYPNADSAGPLNQAGLRHIRAWEDRSAGIQLEILPGFDEDIGHYMPGPDGSNGHFWLGDDITLKTGGDAVHSILDYHYEPQRVTGIRMVVDVAARDDTSETAALSWHVVPELNEVFGTDGDLDSGVGICCGPPICRDRDWGLPIEFLIKQRWEDIHAGMYRTFAARFRNGVDHPYFEVFWDQTGGDISLAVKGVDQDSNTTGYDTAVEVLAAAEGQDFITRFRIEQTEVMARFWFDGDAEPGTWQAVASGGGFSLTDVGVATLNRLEDLLNSQHPSPGTFAQDYLRVVTGFGSLEVSDEFVTPVASGWGTSTINGALWETGGTTTASVAGGEALWTANASEDTVSTQLIIPNLTCTHGGSGANAGDPADGEAAPSSHEHDYVAAGGTIGQVLSKVSDADWDTVWEDPSGGTDLSAINFLVGTASGDLSAEIPVGTTPGGELGGTWASPTVDATHAGGTHAPTAADYLVGTAQAGLSAEIVVGASPGGELGGTWASPTVDATHSGSTHSAATDTHIADAADAHDASAVSVLDTGTNYTGTDVEAVLAELPALIAAAGGGGMAGELVTDTIVGDGVEDTFALSEAPSGSWALVSTNGADLLPTEYAISGGDIIFDVAPVNLSESLVTFITGGFTAPAVDPGDIADPTLATAEDVALKLNALMANLRTEGIIA